MAYRILLSEEIHPRGMEILSGVGEIQVAEDPSEDTLINLIGEADALVVRSSKVSARIIEAGKRLRVIGRHGIGVDNIDLEACARKGVMVVNTPEANVISVAEYVLAAMLALCKRLQQADNALREGVFDQPGSLPGLVTRLGYTNMELYGKSIGLLGLGKIGRRVAMICQHGFCMKVYGYARTMNREEMGTLGIIPCTSLEELFADKDFVSIHVPLTPETKGLVDMRLLKKMKRGSFLINTARGGVVNEDDLCEVLLEGRIAGAAVDVFEKEPPGKDHPLLKLDNILVTPHLAAMTDGALYRMAVDLANDVAAALQGREPKGWYNRPR